MRLSIVRALVATSLLSACDKPAPPAPALAPSAAPAPAPPPPVPQVSTAVAVDTSPPAFVTAQHVLVVYKGAARSDPKITRTKEEARKRAQEVADKAKAGADFADLVRDYSDEPGSIPRQGNLGKFTPDKMVKPFSDAAFALPVGGTSDVVETKFGFHVIKRNQ
jgi:hypothetical protein